MPSVTQRGWANTSVAQTCAQGALVLSLFVNWGCTGSQPETGRSSASEAGPARSDDAGSTRTVEPVTDQAEQPELSSGDDTALGDDSESPRLLPQDNQPDIEDTAKRDAIAHMNMRFDEWADATRKAAESVPDYCRRATFAPRELKFGKPTVAVSPQTSSGVLAWSSPKEPSDVSTTNNQVSGVDEADFVKNDDKYVYAAMNGALRIIEAWPPETAHQVAMVPLDGVPKKLFVEKDRALVYVSRPRPKPEHGVSHSVSRECTYAYDCEVSGDWTETSLVLFDITDRGEPKQLRRIDSDGSLIAARSIGGAVHTMLATPELFLSDVLYPTVNPEDCESGETVAESVATVLAMLEEQRAKNLGVLEAASIEDVLPHIIEDGRNLAAGSGSKVYREAHATGGSYTTLLSLDMTGEDAPAISTIVSKPGTVYATPNALYVAVNMTDADPYRRPSSFRTAIHKFAIGEDIRRARYVASGQVEGNVLNQFSLDEHRGHLRVATSFGQRNHSALSVLEQHGDTLELTGKIDDIAPGEDIRSVRFDRDRGFMVTFKKTDPLYVFELSDPAKPTIAGELEIPGFSTYIHMLDESHLLTIGYDAADQGRFAWFTGVLLQLFDVSDMSMPTLAHKAVIGTRGTSSEALTNHLAFTLFGDKLAVPMTICEGGDEKGREGTPTFSGLMVFDVSVKQGIAERGRVAHPNEQGAYDVKACEHWWTDGASFVQRSLFMDRFVYSIDPNTIRIQDTNALGEDVASVSLTQ
jgi:hypothetical protein